jgi:Domain of unknown function (DUF4386)
VTYLVSFVCVVYANFAIHDRLIVPDAAQTAANIAAHEQLFRAGIVADLIYCICLLLLIAALYVILEPVNKMVAIASSLMKLVYALVWLIMTLTFFDALRLVHGTSYLHVFEPAKLQALAKVFLAGRFERYYGGLLLYSVGAVLSSYLWWRSAYIPRSLSMFGVVSCAWCALCTLIFLIVPTFTHYVNLWFFDLPMALFDFVTSFWLIFKGIRSAHATD